MQRTHVSMAEFEQFVAQPENAGQLFELIHGEMIAVSPGRTRYSEMGHTIAIAVHLFCRERHLPCHTSGGDGAYRILGNVFAPDFAYKSTPMSEEYPDPESPEWVVETISPTDRAADIREKRQVYREAGILLWEIYPQSQSIDVYVPGEALRVVGVDEVLDAANVLPGFTLAAREIFSK